MMMETTMTTVVVVVILVRRFWSILEAIVMHFFMILPFKQLHWSPIVDK